MHQRSRCAEAREQHRAQQYGLQEQRRANDIAEWNLRLAVRQANYTLAQTVATIAAFVAAAVATGIAWRAMRWARIAAKETKRSADAADKGLDAVRTAEAAYLTFSTTTAVGVGGGLVIVAANLGRTLAHVYDVRYASRAKAPKSTKLIGMTLQRLSPDLHIPDGKAERLGETTMLGPEIKYVVGYAQYRDIYKREHRAYFRYDKNSSGIWSAGGGSVWNRTDQGE